jgi:hypothetical protein
MQDVLKIKKGQWKSSKSCLFKHCFIGPMLVVCLRFPPCLNFYLYVPLFAFRNLYLYTSYVRGLHSFALFNELLIYQKFQQDCHASLSLSFSVGRFKWWSPISLGRVGHNALFTKCWKLGVKKVRSLQSSVVRKMVVPCIL